MSDAQPISRKYGRRGVTWAAFSRMREERDVFKRLVSEMVLSANTVEGDAMMFRAIQEAKKVLKGKISDKRRTNDI